MFPTLDFAFNTTIFFQNPASPAACGLIELHNIVMLWLIVILFTILGLFYLIFKGSSLVWEYPEFFGPTKEIKVKGTLLAHSSKLEIVWTTIPSIILIYLAIPSFALLFAMDETQDTEGTIKIIGNQWYWSYELDQNSPIARDNSATPETNPFRLFERLFYHQLNQIAPEVPVIPDTENKVNEAPVIPENKENEVPVIPSQEVCPPYTVFSIKAWLEYFKTLDPQPTFDVDAYKSFFMDGKVLVQQLDFQLALPWLNIVEYLNPVIVINEDTLSSMKNELVQTYELWKSVNPENIDKITRYTIDSLIKSADELSNYNQGVSGPVNEKLIPFFKEIQKNNNIHHTTSNNYSMEEIKNIFHFLGKNTSLYNVIREINNVYGYEKISFTRYIENYNKVLEVRDWALNSANNRFLEQLVQPQSVFETKILLSPKALEALANTSPYRNPNDLDNFPLEKIIKYQLVVTPEALKVLSNTPIFKTQFVYNLNTEGVAKTDINTLDSSAEMKAMEVRKNLSMYIDKYMNHLSPKNKAKVHTAILNIIQPPVVPAAEGTKGSSGGTEGPVGGAEGAIVDVPVIPENKVNEVPVSTSQEVRHPYTAFSTKVWMKDFNLSIIQPPVVPAAEGTKGSSGGTEGLNLPPRASETISEELDPIAQIHNKNSSFKQKFVLEQSSEQNNATRNELAKQSREFQKDISDNNYEPIPEGLLFSTFLESLTEKQKFVLQIAMEAWCKKNGYTTDMMSYSGKLQDDFYRDFCEKFDNNKEIDFLPPGEAAFQILNQFPKAERYSIENRYVLWYKDSEYPRHEINTNLELRDAWVRAMAGEKLSFAGPKSVEEQRQELRDPWVRVMAGENLPLKEGVYAQNLLNSLTKDHRSHAIVNMKIWAEENNHNPSLMLDNGKLRDEWAYQYEKAFPIGKPIPKLILKEREYAQILWASLTEQERRHASVNYNTWMAERAKTDLSDDLPDKEKLLSYTEFLNLFDKKKLLDKSKDEWANIYYDTFLKTAKNEAVYLPPGENLPLKEGVYAQNLLNSLTKDHRSHAIVNMHIWAKKNNKDIALMLDNGKLRDEWAYQYEKAFPIGKPIPKLILKEGAYAQLLWTSMTEQERKDAIVNYNTWMAERDKDEWANIYYDTFLKTENIRYINPARNEEVYLPPQMASENKALVPVGR